MHHKTKQSIKLNPTNDGEFGEMQADITKDDTIFYGNVKVCSGKGENITSRCALQFSFKGNYGNQKIYSSVFGIKKISSYSNISKDGFYAAKVKNTGNYELSYVDCTNYSSNKNGGGNLNLARGVLHTNYSFLVDKLRKKYYFGNININVDRMSYKAEDRFKDDSKLFEKLYSPSDEIPKKTQPRKRASKELHKQSKKTKSK